MRTLRSSSSTALWTLSTFWAASAKTCSETTNPREVERTRMECTLPIPATCVSTSLIMAAIWSLTSIGASSPFKPCASSGSIWVSTSVSSPNSSRIALSILLAIWCAAARLMRPSTSTSNEIDSRPLSSCTVTWCTGTRRFAAISNTRSNIVSSS